MTRIAMVGIVLLAGAGAPAGVRAQYEDWNAAEQSIEPRETPAVAEGEAGARLEPAPEAAPAEEEEVPDAEMPPMAGRFRLHGEVESFIGTFDLEAATATARFDGFAVSPLVGLDFYATDTIRVGAALGLSLLAHSELAGTVMEEGGAAFRFGNPLLKGELLGAAGEKMRYTLGVGLGLPVASADSLPELASLQVATAMRGAWDIWMWAPERLSVVATGRVDVAVSEQVFASAEAAVAILFYGGDSSGETLFVAQGAGDIEYRLGTVGFGGRLAAVLADDALPDRKSMQLSLMPYARLVLPEDRQITLGFLVNLMPPFGFSLSEGKAWSIHLAASTPL